MSFFKNLKQRAVETVMWGKFASMVKPKEKFGDSPVPAAPDYSNLSNWAAHPDKTDKSDMVPAGVSKNTNATPVDVFFIHPTTYFGIFNWNADLNFEAANEWVDELIIPHQASVFNSCCRVFAPRYRQATFYSFLEGGKNGRSALELAYEDVAEAFTYFIKHFNKGRPFFIASHSQGTVHGIRLLEEFVEHSDLYKRMIAAYLIGFEVPMDKFDLAFSNIKPVASADDTGCIIAWDTYLKGGKTKNASDKAEHWYMGEEDEHYWVRRNTKKNFGINPLNWERSTTVALPELNKGAVHVLLKSEKVNYLNTFKGKKVGFNTIGLSKPQLQEVPARLGKDGFLYIAEPKNKRFKTMLLPRGNYHVYDYALFYMNIRENVKTRADAFLKNNV